MFRYLAVISLAAFVAASVYAAGQSAGRAEVEARVLAEVEARRRAADAASAATRERVAALEGERDDLQNAVHRLDARVARDRGRNRACLDARLVRELDAIGRGRDDRGLRPRS